jgi:hypothetical protein
MRPRPPESARETTPNVGDEPSVLESRLAEAGLRGRRLDAQISALTGFERRLSDQLRAARTSARGADAVRELLARRLAVRARLDEATRQRAAVASEEAQLAAALAQEAAAGEADAERLEKIRRAEQERREFLEACLRAPGAGRGS